MSKFEESLKEWLEYENKILKYLNDKWLPFIKNKDDRWIDILLNNISIEIKRDNKSKVTWNFYFETECWWKPSWLFKYSDVTYWIHGVDEYFYLFDIDILKDVVLNKWWQTRWWDYSASRWYIIKEKIIAEYAMWKYFLNSDIWTIETN